MAYPNGRLSTSALTALPASWSNKGKVERLRSDAAAALSRAMLRAVAHTGSNFSVWSAYRDHADQVAMLQKHYRRVNRARRKSSDRSWDGSTWAKRLGHPTVASPGYSNHGTGIAVDIHPGPIQLWLQKHGRRYGWSWDEGRRVGESWHFVYAPSLDEFTGQGTPPVQEVQRVVGVKADGKFGTATVRAVKAWQQKHGLTADGIPGPDTLAVMLGKDDDGAPVSEYTVEQRPTMNRYKGREKDGQIGELSAIVIHHWGAPGQDFDAVVSWLQGDGNGNNDSSAHEVIAGHRVAVLAPPEDATWSTGTRDGNLSTYSFELRPEADEATIRTAAARIRALREAVGIDLPLTVHQDYVNTACPGRWLQLINTLDALARGGDVPIPATGVLPLPTGKDLLVKLTDAPDFPLLRTPAHRCYYGNADGPRESVSGKAPNSLVPGEIFGSGRSSGAHGLRAWQARAGIEADGRFGPATEAKVRQVQQRAGLAVDGKLGPATWYAAWLLPVVA